MNSLTHALASYSLQRAAFPRLSRGATIAIVLAGVVADVDLLSIYFGPSAYLAFTHTYFHSILAALAFTLVATLPFLLLKPKVPENIPVAAVFSAALVAALDRKSTRLNSSHGYLSHAVFCLEKKTSCLGVQASSSAP